MPQYVSAKQLSARLGYSRWWLYELAKLGRIPAYRFNARGHLRFVEAEVVACLQPARPKVSVRLNSAA